MKAFCEVCVCVCAWVFAGARRMQIEQQGCLQARDACRSNNRENTTYVQ